MQKTKEIRRPFYGECDGLLIPPAFSPDAVRSAMNYKPKPGDLFIVTYPKCGTTWMQNIVVLIFHRGVPPTNPMDFLQSSPFIELMGAEALTTMRRPGAIKMHLPLHRAQYSPEAKYIYVARNPRDCCVSFYHQTKSMPYYNYADAPFSDFFELFIKGEVENNDYFDHLIPWYQHKNEPNVHFVTYEDLKEDTSAEVLKVAKFIGEDYYNELQNDPQYLRDVIHFSSFEYMKSTLNIDIDNMFSDPNITLNSDIPLPDGIRYMMEYIKNNPNKSKHSINFVRKGIVGDWKGHFTPEQEKKMEEYIKRKTAGSDVMSLWKDLNQK